MTDEYAPASESLDDRYSDILEQHRAEHGDIFSSWVEGDIGHWRFADGYILRIDVKDYADGYFDVTAAPAGGSSGSAQPEIDEVTKAQLRQMALAVAAEGSNPDDVVELVQRANYIAAWLTTGQPDQEQDIYRERAEAAEQERDHFKTRFNEVANEAARLRQQLLKERDELEAENATAATRERDAAREADPQSTPQEAAGGPERDAGATDG